MTNKPEDWHSEYIEGIKEILSSEDAFNNFKTNPKYQSVLEHTCGDLGYAYCDEAYKNFPLFVNYYKQLVKNDIIGNPHLMAINGFGMVSPSTLRYIKVATDLLKYFGKNIGDNIYEIGGGYGGQLITIDSIFEFKKYTIVDLHPVLELVEKYVESYILNNSYDVKTMNQLGEDIDVDLLISNYAFSELDIKVQTKYINKLIKSSKRGYMTMNCGKYPNNKVSIDTLKDLKSDLTIIDETPNSNSINPENNFIVLWGCNNQK